MRLSYSGHVVGGRKLRKDVFQADSFDHEKALGPRLGFVESIFLARQASQMRK